MSQATISSEPYVNSNLFSGYYLDNRVDDLDAWDCDEQAQETFDKLRDLWELEGDLVASYKEDDLLDSWIDEVLGILGFGTLSETTLPNSGGYTDRLLFESETTRRDAALMRKEGDSEAMFGLGSAVLEAKQWGADFTTRFSEQRSYRDASHQIKYYLERTPERLQWGILTDGRKWRLYGTKDYATETYYEVDLPELLATGDLESFKYFYVFFRPEAFHEIAGTTFLDTVWNESESAAQELGEDLQDNVFTALRVLGEGFVESNDLDIDPEDESAREDLKEQSLVLLYRLMFVLYAESRHLIEPDDPNAEDHFREDFSLDQLRLDIHERIESGDSFEDFSDLATSMWGRLQDLFRLVDTGQDELGIPPYNGGLFDDDRHAFLADHQVSDRYIAEVIYRLGTTETENGSFVLADYADLDTRHLGTIYEGLLEHEFRIASEQYAAVAEDGGQVWEPATEVSVADAVETVEKGELYVVNDDGERKATGAYYTPDYVVAYIVEETVDPLVAEIKTDLESDGLEPSDREFFMRFWQRVLDLKVLDPAMGSGHFLTKATGYLTERVMEVVREQEIQSYDEQDLRREIAKECIYGVDVNGMAVELAKLSMWLETLAADQPLAFLDHHLKSGNSLVGSDITEVLSNGTEENGGQITLTQAFAKVRERTLEHVMDLMEDLLAIDNETLADIKSMEDIYDEIRADPLYQRLFEMANVHTAERFGLDVPADTYELMAQAIEDEDEWAEIQEKDWFYTAQVTAEEESFFHWELEFPEVFFGGEGSKREDAGFDAVVGNPPYLAFQQGTSEERDYYNIEYETPHRTYDIYIVFLEKGIQLTKSNGGYTSYIIPNKFIRSQYGEKLRDYIWEHTHLKSLIDFDDGEVFKDATNYVCIPVLERGAIYDSSLFIEKNSPRRAIRNASNGDGWTVIPIEAMKEWQMLDESVYDVLSKVEKHPVLIELVDDIFEGARPGGEKIYYNVDSNTEEDLLRPFIKAEDIDPYHIKLDKRIIFPYRKTNDGYGLIDLRDYPNALQHLTDCSNDIYGENGEQFGIDIEYGYYHTPDRIESESLIICPDISMENEFATTESQPIVFPNTIYAVDATNATEPTKYLVAILNSTLLELKLKSISPNVRGGYYRYKTEYLEQLPIVPINKGIHEVDASDTSQVVSGYIKGNKEVDSILSEIPDKEPYLQSVLCWLANERREQMRSKESLNLSLRDYLGSYSNGPTLSEIGFTQPPEDSADSILNETAEQKPNLRVGEATVIYESPSTVEIRLTARYKPDDESEHETGPHGYTETEPLPALTVTDLTETEADLIEAFVPHAVDEAGGFAGFRETATKTNSLIDRLRKLTLPHVDDVREGLADYRETMERAEELEEKIQRTDDLIDQIVYELYGLTDEEIEIVEQAVNG